MEKEEEQNKKVNLSSDFLINDWRNRGERRSVNGYGLAVLDSG